MPRVKKKRPKPNRLDDSINVPVSVALKKRVITLASQEPGSPAHTRFARTLIEEGVERREQPAATPTGDGAVQPSADGTAEELVAAS